MEKKRYNEWFKMNQCPSLKDNELCLIRCLNGETTETYLVRYDKKQDMWKRIPDGKYGCGAHEIMIIEDKMLKTTTENII